MSNPKCPAALTIKGQHYACDWPTDERGRHSGWAHSSKAAEAIWEAAPTVEQWRSLPWRSGDPGGRGLYVDDGGAGLFLGVMESPELAASVALHRNGDLP